MNQEPDDLDRLLGSLGREGRLQPDPDPEEHPGSATLFAYYEGKLSPEQRAQVEEHLSICGRCRDLLVEYKEFAEDPVEADGEPGERRRGADFGAAADWHRLREKMGEEDRRSRIDAAYEPGTPRGVFRSSRTAYPIAAVLALALIGLSIYTVNSWHQDKTPKETTREIFISPDNRAELEAVVLPPGEDKEIPFRLIAPDNRAYPKYVLKVFDSADREVLVRDSLEANGPEEFRFTLNSSVFKPGINTLRIFALDNGTPILLGEFQFRLIRQTQ